jgi:hypothetical protein
MDQPSSEFKSKGGIKRIVAAFGYSMDGFRAALLNEHAFRQELMVAVPAAIIALVLKISAFEKLVLILVLGLVLLVEPGIAGTPSAVQGRQGPGQRGGGAGDHDGRGHLGRGAVQPLFLMFRRIH